MQQGVSLLAALPLVLAWNHINGKDLARAVEDGDFKLVSFVNPTEPSSAALESEWLLAKSEAPEALLNIDCSDSANRDVCATHASNGYPTIRIFHRDSPKDVYQGPKRARAIINYLERQKRPVVTELTSKEAYVEFQNADEVVFVAYATTEDQREAVRGLAGRFHGEFTFGLTDDPAVVGREDKPAQAIIACHRRAADDTDAVTNTHPLVGPNGDEVVDPSVLDAFVDDASRPDIAELTRASHARHTARGLPIVYLLAPTEAERAGLRAEMRRLARNYRDVFTVLTVDPADFPELPPALGLASPVLGPAGALHQLSSGRVYPYPAGRSVDPRAVQKWGLDVFQGRVKPWTPPGVTTSYDDLGPTRVASATRRLSVANIPGVKIKIAGHVQDEL